MSNLDAIHSAEIDLSRSSKLPKCVSIYGIQQAFLSSPPPVALSLHHYIKSALFSQPDALPEWMKGLGELGKLVSVEMRGEVYVATFVPHEASPAAPQEEGEIQPNASIMLSAHVFDAIINSGMLNEADNVCFGRVEEGLLDHICAYTLVV